MKSALAAHCAIRGNKFMAIGAAGGGFRELTGRELGLVKQLTQPDFIGAAQLREQLEACEARTVDPEGSFELRVKNKAPARVFYRVPVELQARDRDGTPIHVLLHVIDGIAKQIEVYKDAPTPIAAWPSHWDVLVSGPQKKARATP